MSRYRTLMVAAGMSILGTISQSAEQAPAAPPPGPGLDLIQRSCVGCHDIYMITTRHKTPEEWATIVGLMADRGAEVTPDEMQIIEAYLSQNFSTTAASSTATQ